MAAGLNIQDGVLGTNQLVGVDANGNLTVNLPTLLARAGYVELAGALSDGTAFPSTAPRAGRRIEASDSFRVRSAIDSPLLSAQFPGAALDGSLWNQTSSTMTLAVTGGFLNLNSGSSIGTNARIQVFSYRSFPIFHDLSTRFDCCLQFPQTPQSNMTMEWGLFLCATTSAPTDGVLFRIQSTGNVTAVVNFNGTENVQDLGFTVAAATRYEFSIVVDVNQALFYVNNNLACTLAVPTAGAISTAVPTQPACFRIYNAAIAPSVANQIKIATCSVTVMDATAGRPWAASIAGMGGNAVQATYNGSTTGQTTSYANSAAPASATLSNTAAGYTTLGGQWQFAAVAGAETDYALFAFQVPATTAAVQGKTLNVTGIRIDSYNMGATVATTPTLLQWGLGSGSSAVTLVGTVDSAGVKIVRRIALGVQSLPIGAVVGANAGNPIDRQFSTPFVVNSGEFLHVILKMPVGTATASQVVRGTCFIEGYFE